MTTLQPDLIKAAAQAMVFLNSQLPAGQFATPQVRYMSEYTDPISADYIMVWPQMVEYR